MSLHRTRHSRTGYLVTHHSAGGGAMTLKRYALKSTATDTAYSIVNQRGGSSLVEHATRRFRWGDAGLVSAVAFSWNGKGEIVADVTP